MKRFTLATLLVIVLSACASTPATPAQSLIETAIAQTQIAIPAATQLPFSALDLESVLIVNGDLPPGYAAAQIRSKLSDISKKSPKPDYFISQSISHNGDLGGIIDVLVFEDAEKAKSAYLIIKDNLPGGGGSTNIGDRGQIASASFLVSVVSLSFIHCHAVISVQFMGTTQEADLMSYAKRLDERLQPIICR